jgi:zona occludens toxin
VHTKIKRAVPTAAKLFALGLVVLIGVSLYGYRSVQQKMAAPMSSLPAVPGATPAGGAPGAPGAPAKLSAIALTAPRVEGLAHTAPMYDQVTVPKSVPFPVACITSSSRCACYTDQMTRLQMEDAMCRQIASDGLYRPWIEPARAEPARPAASAQAAAERVPGASRELIAQVAASDEVYVIPSEFTNTHVRGSGRAPGPAPVKPNATAPGALSAAATGPR